MQFGCTLQQIFKHVLLVNYALGKVFLSKVDLFDAYMCDWVCLEYTPRSACVVSLHPSDTQLLIGFHLSLPMGYVNSAPTSDDQARPFMILLTKSVRPAPLLCCTTSTPLLTPHPQFPTMYMTALTPPSPTSVPASFRTPVSVSSVWFNNFVTLEQGVPVVQHQFFWHIFHHI